jgi:pyruvate/2-oxoglutarate dehydrogenase complex dihydrolipoamide acyltransferase (E2) component
MTIDITAPLLPPSTLSYIGRWFKRGATLSLSTETDGATLELRAPATGVLSSIILTDGQSVQSGDHRGTITEY